MDTKKIKLVKKVIIKNPKLRSIRNNLRTIIKLAVINEYKRLRSLYGLYLEKQMKLYALNPSKTLTPSQEKRVKLLLHKEEYLTITFANSICACASKRVINDNDIKGDRVRVSVISEFEENMVPHMGARYTLEEKWYSLQYYQESHSSFEKISRVMQERIRRHPGPVITPQGLYQLGLKTLNEYGFA